MFDMNEINAQAEEATPEQQNKALVRSVLPDRIKQMEEARKRKWYGVLEYPEDDNEPLLHVTALYLEEIRLRMEMIEIPDELDDVQSKIYGLLEQVARVETLPFTALKIAQAAAVPLSGTVCTTLHKNGFQLYSWNGTYYEGGDDSKRFNAIATGVVEGIRRSVHDYTDELAEMLTGLDGEYKQALEVAKPQIKAIKNAPYVKDEDKTEKQNEEAEKAHKKAQATQAMMAKAAIFSEYFTPGLVQIQPRLGTLRKDMGMYEGGSARATLETHLKGTLAIPETAFDSNDNLVFENGVLNIPEVLETRQVTLQPHSPSRRVLERHRVGTEYLEFPDMDINDLSDLAPHFETYLRGLDEYDEETGITISHRDDMVNLFRANAVGLFSGRSLRCTPFLYGESGSGKGMFIRLMQKLFPGHATTGGRSVFTHGKDSDKYAGGDVIDNRLVFNDEMAGVNLDQDTLKDWSGGSEVRVLRKYRDSEKVKFTGVINTILNTTSEYVPILDLADPGMRTRAMLLYFHQPHSELESSESTLEEKIHAEELPVVVAFMLRLWLAWEDTDLTDTIPLTDHQKSLLLMNRTDDRVNVVLEAGVDDKVWTEVPKDEKISSKNLLNFTKFSKFYDLYSRLYYKEGIKRNTLLADLRAKGLIVEHNRSNRIAGYVEGGEWSQTIAAMELRMEEAKERGL